MDSDVRRSTGAPRRQELAESLERHLAEATEQQHLTRRERIDWLSYHLGLYVGRFAAFADSLGDRAPALLNADPFVAVELGTNRLTRELQFANAPGQVLAMWHRYLDALDRVRSAPTIESIGALRSEIANWQNAFATENW